jgi:hypothetical protein
MSGHGGVSGGGVNAPELSTVAEPSQEDAETPTGGSTLPALGGGTGSRWKSETFAAPSGGDIHGDDDADQAPEDATTLPPIQKALGNRHEGKQRMGKEKKETKAFKAVANATLRGSSGSFHANPAASETASSSKGFNRQPEGATSLAGSAYGKKFGQNSALTQGSTFGQSSYGNSSQFGQSSNFGQTNTSNYAANTGAAERRDPKGGLRGGLAVHRRGHY